MEHICKGELYGQLAMVSRYSVCVHAFLFASYICEDMCILLCTLVADKSVQIRFKLWKFIYFAGHVLTKTQRAVLKPEAERTHKHTKCQWPARKANAAYSLSDYKQG